MSGRSIQSWKRSRGSNAAPAPRLIPAETKNQPRTNIESGTANGGTSGGHRKGERPHFAGLAGRAPYFHNGSAATLADVILFYEMRFNIGFAPQEKADLIAFLNSL
jgi:cytochrome c peroxidase